MDKSGVSDCDGSETTHSAAEHSDGTVNEVEYVNPRGVRFMPQTAAKEGED